MNQHARSVQELLRKLADTHKGNPDKFDEAVLIVAISERSKIEPLMDRDKIALRMTPNGKSLCDTMGRTPHELSFLFNDQWETATEIMRLRVPGTLKLLADYMPEHEPGDAGKELERIGELLIAAAKGTHDLEYDEVGMFSSRPRITCHTCNKTLVYQPYMGSSWNERKAAFLAEHPGTPEEGG